MSTEQPSQDPTPSDIRKAKIYPLLEGLSGGIYAAAGAAAAVTVAAAGAGAGAAVVGAAAVTVAVIAAAGAVVAVVGVVVADDMVASTVRKPPNDATPKAVSDTYRKLGKFLGFTLPVLAGIAVGTSAYDAADHQTEAAPTPTPVTTPAKTTASVTCPAGTIVELTEKFNADNGTTLTLPAPTLEQAGCTISIHPSAQQPAP